MDCSPSVRSPLRARTCACLAAALAILPWPGGTTAFGAPGERPNVIFILADDLGFGELGSYGQEKIRTPNLDRLASEGMRFTRHYSGAPVCAPSRCVLMTGRHLGHAQIRGNRQAKRSFPEFDEGQHPITDDVVTIAEVFKSAGYATGAMGKWGLGPVGSTGDPNRQGFDHFFGYNCQAVAHSFYPKFLWDDDRHVLVNENPVPGHAKQPEGEVRMADWFGEKYASELILADALEFLDEAARREGVPFFLYLPFTEPHVAMHPPKELVESYPEEWDDRPYRGQCAYLPHPRPRAGYAAMITDLDRHVGAVLERVEALGIREETLIVFTSDNGTTHTHPADDRFGIGGVDAAFFNSTAGLRGFKGSVHEGGIRVPLIVRWPGVVAAGSTCDFPSYFADHFPTLCGLAGIDPAPAGALDGISLAPLLTGEGEAPERNPMVWVFPEYGGQVAVSFGRFKAVRTGLAGRRAPDPWELYDLDQDPGETTNVADAHPEILKRAQDVLRGQAAENEIFPVDIAKALGQE